MGNCSCVYVDNSGDNVCIKQKVQVARKPNQCHECDRKINVGEKYEYYFGKTDGESFYSITCLDCVSIRESFFCDGYNFGGTYVYLEEHINEMDGEISSDCIIGLTPRAKDIVCGMIEKCWNDCDC